MFPLVRNVYDAYARDARALRRCVVLLCAVDAGVCVGRPGRKAYCLKLILCTELTHAPEEKPNEPNQPARLHTEKPPLCYTLTQNSHTIHSHPLNICSVPCVYDLCMCESHAHAVNIAILCKYAGAHIEKNAWHMCTGQHNISHDKSLWRSPESPATRDEEIERENKIFVSAWHGNSAIRLRVFVVVPVQTLYILRI